jgi:DNA-binding PadR family transcriptional regulator
VEQRLLHGTPNNKTTSIIKGWLRKGLVRKSICPTPRGRPRVCYVLGPKGQQYLDSINRTDDQK